MSKKLTNAEIKKLNKEKMKTLKGHKVIIKPKSNDKSN